MPKSTSNTIARLTTFFALIAVACGVSDCVTSANLNEVVNNMNLAARFGRPDIAVDYVAPDERSAFLQRHSHWGNDVRIVDVEYAGVEQSSPSEVSVLVGYSWVRPNEGVLRVTSVRQKWSNARGAWSLIAEERAAGDVGLLAEKVEVLRPEHPDVQFPTREIK
jgi:hypothetical protein